MANTMRWRYGDTNPVMLPVGTDTEIEIGDLVYLDSGSAKPASDMADQGSSTLTTQEFQDYFVGIAMQASSVGDVASIRIATSGVFEFECDSATHELGQTMTVAINLAGDQLFDQKVLSTASLPAAIGRCARQVTTASTRVLVDVVSTVLRGGPQDRE